jgi:DNA-binding transcriptional ArsR family regulator
MTQFDTAELHRLRQVGSRFPVAGRGSRLTPPAQSLDILLGQQHGEIIMSTSHNAASRLLQAGHPAIDQATALLKALANDNRLRILCLLDGSELSVTELNQRLALSQSALSQHLAILRREGLVSTRRASQTIYYSLQGEQARQMIDTLVRLQDA